MHQATYEETTFVLHIQLGAWLSITLQITTGETAGPSMVGMAWSFDTSEEVAHLLGMQGCRFEPGGSQQTPEKVTSSFILCRSVNP